MSEGNGSAPYWAKVGKRDRKRCNATLPGAGRCYRKRRHPGAHKAGDKVKPVEFELRLGSALEPAKERG